MEEVLLTGASKGLGMQLAIALAESGRHVFAGARNTDPMERAFAPYAGQITWFHLDVASEESVAQAVKGVADRTDRLDAVVNNAAVLLRETVGRPLEELDFESMDRTLSVNSVGPLRVLKHALPLLDAGSRKLVVNISSEAGGIQECARTAWYDYCMSKAALNMASKILQNYLRDRGCKVLAVHPGWMRTEMGGVEATMDPAEVAHKIVHLMERRWSPSDPIFVDTDGTLMSW